MQVERDTLKKLRVDVDAALAKIAKEYGFAALQMGRCTFDNNGSFRFQVEGTAAGGKSKDEQYYEQLRAYTPNLPALGSPEATRMFDRTKGTIVGASSTGAKILIRHEDTAKVYLYKAVYVSSLYLVTK